MDRQQSEQAEQGECEVWPLFGSYATCGKPATYRYADASRGYARLCEEHGQKFATTYGTERWRDGAWHTQEETK